MKVRYSSNNSGGDWWLSDNDWKSLEAAGWYVEWGGEYLCHPDINIFKAPEGKPEPHKTEKECHGHRKCDNAAEAEKYRHLGALATKAEKDFDSIANAIKEFETITGQDVTDEGCNCCGAPHTFYWGACALAECDCPERTPHKDYHYASGEDLLEYIYPNKDTHLSKRELLDKAA